MRETNFIEQNKEKWAKFEDVLNSKKKDAEQLSTLFVDITDDLSYSRTFYPNRSVRVYLNGIAQRVFYSIYKNRKSRLKSVWTFWNEKVPQVLYEARRSLFLSLCIFMLAVVIGAFSSHMAPEFPRVILGDGYVDMTLTNIESGKPMSVYQGGDEFDAFFRIGLNNLKVALMTFLLGLFFSVGSIYILMYNGIMVGAFQYLFIREGVYLDSILTIWIHGTIEISCIIIAGAAGITMGNGLVFPGTFTRLQSLQLSARKGIYIMLTIIPLIIFAAFIESFITRYTEAPYVLRAIIILASLFFVLYFFVWNPYRKAKRRKTSFMREVQLPPSKDDTINFAKIKNSGQIFSDTFMFYRKNIKKIGTLALILASVYTTIIMFTGEARAFVFEPENMFFLELPEQIVASLIQLLIPSTAFNLSSGLQETIMFLNIGASIVMGYFLLFFIQKQAHSSLSKLEGSTLKKPNQPLFHAFSIATMAAASIAIGFILNVSEETVIFWMIFVIPLFLLWAATVFCEGVNPISGLGKMFSILRGNWMAMMGAYLVMLLMCTVFMSLCSAPIMTFYYNVLTAAFPMSEAEQVMFHQGFYLFINSFLLCFLFPLLYAVMGIAYYSFRETRQADDLKRKIPFIGVHKKSYGMARED